MSEYIKKEEATSIPVIPKEHRKHFNDLDDAFETGWNEALACVNMIPSADVAEVVRCKDCKHRERCYSAIVMTKECKGDTFFKDIDYCSFGEREDDEQEEREIINARKGEE